MDEKLKELAARIAAIGGAWIQPGVLVTGLNAGADWRCICNDGAEAFWISYGKRTQMLTARVVDGDNSHPSCARAIAAGPDLTDAATLGVLLLSIGDVEMQHLRHPSSRMWFWNCNRSVSGWKLGFSVNGPTRAEAIAKAWLAANEVKNG